jgi:hypothetical protein
MICCAIVREIKTGREKETEIEREMEREMRRKMEINKRSLHTEQHDAV